MKKYKELSKRLDKIEKHLCLNTEVSLFESPEGNNFEWLKPELTELPEKWCVKMDNQEVIDYCNENGEMPPYSQRSDLFAQFPSVNRCTSASWITEGYTEITLEQFKKWVLKEDVVKRDTPKEKPALGNTDTSLSIREVQVKITSQEEANECAEIARACGEKVGNIFVSEHFNIFRIDRHTGVFFVSSIPNLKTEISIQEYIERFGKPTEIYWSKAGQYVTNKHNAVWRTTGNHNGIYFEGHLLRFADENDNPYAILFEKRSDVVKKGFKLCTEPITLSND